MPFEDDLGAALRRTGDTFSTDSRALVAAGLAQGRSAHRRRTAAVAGTVAAVAAAGVTAALVVPGGSARDVGPATTSSPDPTRPSEDRDKGADDGTLLGALEHLLPKGRILSRRASDVETSPYAEVVWDDGHGASTISVGLSRVEPGEGVTCPDLALMKPGTTCERTPLPGKATLLVVKGWEYQDDRKGPKNWRATVTGADGRQVMVTEWNAAEEKAKKQSREEPPLTASQLGILARSSQWGPFLESVPELPASNGEPGSEAGGPSAEHILKLLRKLLPQGLKITVPPGQSGGYVHLTVDDGQGATFVEVDFQPYQADLVDDSLYAGATVLPDGTKLVTRRDGGDKGGVGIVRWAADTIRPDGLRVVVTAFNSDGYHRPITRQKPAVSMDALVKAATDSRWKALG
ncbi:hypothetical protein ACFW3D_39390 [Streptomyces sp. NPDC058864]